MRLCACGCGRPLEGGARQRFARDACRKRFERWQAKADTKADIYPDNPDMNADNPDAKADNPETLLEAVEVLIDEFPALAPPLAASLRLLAGQLDAQPDRSPLWGRFSALLEQALEAWSRARPLDPEAAALVGALHGCRDPEQHRQAGWTHCSLCCHGSETAALDAYRARLAREARERGEDPARYSRLVPSGCARQEHRAVPWPGGLATCEDCGEVVGGLLAPP